MAVSNSSMQALGALAVLAVVVVALSFLQPGMFKGVFVDIDANGPFRSP